MCEKTLPKHGNFGKSIPNRCIEAVSYCDGKEVSRRMLQTVGQPAAIKLVPEKVQMKADGHDVIYVGIEILDGEGKLIPDCEMPLTAKVEGVASLAGFGTGNPKTDEDYTDNQTVSYRGRPMAILRSGYEAGEVTLCVGAEGLAAVTAKLSVE